MIEEYRFGSITIKGRTYTDDIELRWGGEAVDWQREEGHIMDTGDFQRTISQKPEIIVVGTGASGVAKVTEEAQKAIIEQGIKIMIDITSEAVKVFNILQNQGKRVVGLFHLTC